MRRAIGILGLLVLVTVLGGVVDGPRGRALAQEALDDPYPLKPPDTASPRATVRSLQQYAREAIQRYQAREPAAVVRRATQRAFRALDLSQVPPAVRRTQGRELGLMLIEILDRIELPPPDEIPGVEAVEAEGLTSWTIPNTEITIARTEEGPYAGEFQFTAHTVAQLPAFYEQTKHLPYKPGALVGIYEDLIYSPGPWLPRAWTANLPGFAYEIWWDQAVWQWLSALVTLLLAAAVILLTYRFGSHVDRPAHATAARRHLGRVIATLVAIPLLHLTSQFLERGVNLTGIPLIGVQLALNVAVAIALGWLIVLILDAIGEAIIRSRAAEAGSVDAQLVRIVVRLFGILVLIYLALYVAESFGIPAAPLIASLGVGGLAIALAVRPTLENVVGGFILFADKPVRVGEFCQFGDKMGTIELIGLRSTRIRGLDRTVITVPNADFAQMQIVNFTRRDQMLLSTTLGLRYETTPDQLRYVLARLREMFVAHPRVLPEPGRARFAGFGESSLNVDIFVYVQSRDYNEFLAIAEDIHLRIMDIVAEAGTGFAFPSQTAYLTRDQGLDAERARTAEAEVETWRAEGTLPFPKLDPRRVAALDGSLDFPPNGSAQHRQPATSAESAAAPQAPPARRWGLGRSAAGKR